MNSGTSLLMVLLAIGSIATSLAETPINQWTLRAGKDEFTDESYFLIAPPLTETPVPGKRDRSARRDAMKPLTDLSYFLRPFVAVDNGTLLVGATVEGRISVSLYGGAPSQLSSTFPVGVVRWRVDQNATIDIDASANPEIHLPGASLAAPGMPASQGLPPEMADFASHIGNSSAYAAVSGATADLLLDQMLAGKVIKIARKPNSMLGQMGTTGTYVDVKTFTVGQEVRALIDQIGLRKNPGTGRWELDPAKEAFRQALLAKAAP